MTEKIPEHPQLSILIQHLAVRLTANMQQLFKLEDEVIEGADGNKKLEAKAQKTWDEYASDAGIEINYEEFDAFTQLEMIEKLKLLIPRRTQLQQDIKGIKSRIAKSQTVQEVTFTPETPPITSQAKVESDSIIPTQEEHPNQEVINRIREHMEIEMEGLNEEQKAEVQGYIESLVKALSYTFSNKYQVPFYSDVMTRVANLKKLEEPYKFLTLINDHSEYGEANLKLAQKEITPTFAQSMISQTKKIFGINYNNNILKTVDHIINTGGFDGNQDIFKSKKQNDLLLAFGFNEFILILVIANYYKLQSSPVIIEQQVKKLVEEVKPEKTPTEIILEFIEANKKLISLAANINGNSRPKEIKTVYINPGLKSSFENFVNTQLVYPKKHYKELLESNRIIDQRFIALISFNIYIEDWATVLSQILKVGKDFWIKIIRSLAIENPDKINTNHFSLLPTEFTEPGVEKIYDYELSDSRTFGLWMKMMIAILELAEPKLLELAKKIEDERQTVEVTSKNEDQADETAVTIQLPEKDKVKLEDYVIPDELIIKLDPTTITHEQIQTYTRLFFNLQLSMDSIPLTNIQTLLKSLQEFWISTNFPGSISILDNYRSILKDANKKISPDLSYIYNTSTTLPSNEIAKSVIREQSYIFATISMAYMNQLASVDFIKKIPTYQNKSATIKILQTKKKYHNDEIKEIESGLKKIDSSNSSARKEKATGITVRNLQTLLDNCVQSQKAQTVDIQYTTILASITETLMRWEFPESIQIAYLVVRLKNELDKLSTTGQLAQLKTIEILRARAKLTEFKAKATQSLINKLR